MIIDNEQAAFDATTHLIDHGHTRIANVAGPGNNILTVDRTAGYRRALTENGIEIDPALTFVGDYSIDSGIAAGRALLADPKTRPTGLFCASDGMAIGVIVAAKELGLRVPQDVSVFGFDDIHLAAAYDPPLTTVRQPRRRLGERAIALLLDRLDPTTPNKPAQPGPVIVPTELIIRQSTGPCPKS